MQALTRVARPVLTCKAPPIRTFTTLSPIRPSLYVAATTIRRPTGVMTSFAPLLPSSAVAADVVPAWAISAHPAQKGRAKLGCH
ncbi:hypothetical protein LLEC1_03554 [Akanthomyces lecanii]|uniref:Uncharacterized protein n=1 Tax=Cordyceps confragosa TaxID=2714763 RepID=A0A179I6T5_CORDF|nr:hypothetical protein LLEC1_03554 [Akanthomyces lecanii]